MKSTSRTIFLIFSSFISAITLTFLLVNLDWKSIQSLSAQIRWQWVVISFVIYFLNIFLRTERYKNLLNSRSASNLELLSITSLHNLFTYILPARTGELSYLFLTKDRLKAPLAEGTATLFASRIYDLLSTSLIFLLALPFTWHKLPRWANQASLIFSILVIAIYFVVFIFLRSKTTFLNRFETFGPTAKRVWLFIKRLIAELQAIQHNNKHYRIGLLTVGIWTCLYTNFYIMCRALNFSVNFFQVILVSLIMIPLSLTPVQGFANLGSHELTWVIVLMVFGTSYQTALNVAVGTHFLTIANILFFGLLSLIALRLHPRKYQAQE